MQLNILFQTIRPPSSLSKRIAIFVYRCHRFLFLCACKNHTFFFFRDIFSGITMDPNRAQGPQLPGLGSRNWKIFYLSHNLTPRHEAYKHKLRKRKHRRQFNLIKVKNELSQNSSNKDDIRSNNNF